MPDVLKTVGRYEILREVGRGGMAMVYLARQTDLDRFVALKELAAFHAYDAAFAQRYLRESRVAGSLSHPNIVTVHDYFEHELLREVGAAHDHTRVRVRDRAHELLPAVQRPVDHDEIGLEQRGRLPGLRDAPRVPDAGDLREALQAGDQTTTVDRVGIDDEEVHTIPASSEHARLPGRLCCPARGVTAYYARPALMESAGPLNRYDKDVRGA